MQKSIRIFLCIFLTLPILSCDRVEFSNLTKKSLGSLAAKSSSFLSTENKSETKVSPRNIGSIIADAQPKVSLGGSFSNSIKLAVQSDPRVISARQDYEAQLASVNLLEGDKDFQVSSTLYGGVEDVSDETTGLAIVLNARKMIYDGGILEKSISAEQSLSVAAYQNMLVQMNKSAQESAVAWVEFERYNSLNNLIRSRLAVLDPLIVQLEKVAEAGVGDKTQVAAAQRTVMMIRVTQSDVAERFELAKVNFKNRFGALPSEVTFDASLISKAVPSRVDRSDLLRVPSLIAGYEAYKASVARLGAIQAKADFSVGFESKIQRPFANSEYDSDESVGLVIKKTLYDGKKLLSEVNKARSAAESSMAKLQATYREGKRLVENAQQTIVALDSAMDIAADNARASAEEISFLRKQLIIGQSTLDSVLSAEARLYDAESKEIQFLADQRLAELSILSTMGLMTPLLGL